MNMSVGDLKSTFHVIEKDAPWHRKRYAKLSKKMLHSANMEHISRGEWSMFSDEMEHDLTYHGASFQSLWYVLFQTSQRAVCTILLLVGILQVHSYDIFNVNSMETAVTATDDVYGQVTNKDWSRWFQFNSSNSGVEDNTSPYWTEFDIHVTSIKPANNSYKYLDVTTCNQLLTDNWLDPTQMVVLHGDKSKLKDYSGYVSFEFTLPVKDVNSKKVSAVNGQWVVEGASGTKWTLKLAAHNGVDNTAIVAVAKNGNAYGPEEICYLDYQFNQNGVTIAKNIRINYHGLENYSALYPAATDLLNKMGAYNSEGAANYNSYLEDNIDRTLTAYMKIIFVNTLGNNPPVIKNLFNVRFLRPINVSAKSFEWDDSSINDNRIPIKDLVEIVDWNQKPVVAYNSEKIDASKTVFGITQPAYSTVYNNYNSMKQQNEGIPYEYYGISELAVRYDEIRTDYAKGPTVRANKYYEKDQIIANTDLVKNLNSFTNRPETNLKTISLLNADGTVVSFDIAHAYNHSDLNVTGKGTQFGWLYYNNNSSVTQEFHIYVPIAVKYNWGSIIYDYLLDPAGTKLDNDYTQTVWAVITVPAKEVPATVTANSYTIEYGDAIPKLEYTSEGGELSGTPELKCDATSTSPVGTYPIVITKGSVQNNSVTYVNGTLTITKAPLTITAKSYTRKQGEANPAFEVIYSGFKNNETTSVLTKLPTVSTTATENSSPGKYDITVSGAEARNYSMDYVKGTLTVTEADPITVTALDYTREYGDDNPNFDFTVSGATLNGTPTITCSATKNSPVGTYPIKISQGSVSNYNVTYVDGTLTITKAPLTITAQSYTRKQGEDNPTFEVTYSGFKNNETSSVLAKQPTVSTTATKDSRVGTYDITVSGAEAQNYDISYVKGTLTITQADAIVVTATSYTREYGDDNPTFDYSVNGGTLNGTPKISCSATKTTPVGTYTIKIEKGSITNSNVTYVEGTLTITKAPLTITAKSYTREEGQDNPTFEVTYDGFKNNETSSVLTQMPTVTTAATANSPAGTYDITVFGAEAQNYSISYVKGTLTVTESKPVSFTQNGITYYGAKSMLTAIVLSVDNNLMNVEIPSSVIYDGITYQVTSIASGALSNHTFNYVSLPSTITSVETGIFNNSIMGALIWNADASLSSSIFSNMAMPTTSNFLLYVNSESYAPSNVSNVIVGNTSNSITFVDTRNANNFYCPQEFTAQSISYSHNYNMTSGLNESRGWETIALPFDVQKITHANKGEILPFAKWKSGYLQKPFWLMELTSSGWTAAESIKANTPYIISMPNNQEYKTGFLLNGNVTFSAENVKVHKTENLHPAVFESKTFVPNFALKESEVYALNVVNDLEQNHGDATEGSTFIWNLRPVHPFEAFMTTTQSTRSISISEAMPTGIIGITEIIKKNSAFYYDLQGRRVMQPAKGVYIKNRKKMIIR